MAPTTWPDVALFACAAAVFISLFWAMAWSDAREAEANAKRPAQARSPKSDPGSAFTWPNVEFSFPGITNECRTLSMSTGQTWRERESGKLFRIRSLDRASDECVTLEEVGAPSGESNTRRVNTEWFFDEADLVTDDAAKEPSA